MWSNYLGRYVSISCASDLSSFLWSGLWAPLGGKKAIHYHVVWREEEKKTPKKTNKYRILQQGLFSQYGHN